VKAYLDSSVVLRRVFEEPGAIQTWSQWELVMASELLQVEGFRAIDRLRVVNELQDAKVADLMDSFRQHLNGIYAIAIDAAVLPLAEEPAIPMGTLKKRIEDPCEIDDPNVVKVVTDRFENAIYFSRSTIPYQRDKTKGKRQEGQAKRSEVVHYKHIGLYVYRRDFLLRYPGLPVGPLERAEQLEQLRALENGHKIRVVETEYESIGVDAPEDLARVTKLFEMSLAGVIQNG